MTPEGKIKSACCEYLDKCNIYWERRESFGFSYKAGVPDIWCVINGKHIEIEFKREEGGALSSPQIKWITKLRSKGVMCLVIDHFADFKEKIDKEMNPLG